MTFLDKLFTFAILVIATGLLALWIKDKSPQGPKVLMLCTRAGEGCTPYVQPQPFTGYNN